MVGGDKNAASAIEFRLRVAITAVIVTLGFWAPWIEAWDSSIGFFQRMSLLEWLALEYLAYRRAVPRLIPRLRTTRQGAGAKPRWLRALVMELNPIGVFLTLAVLSWSYDHTLMIKAILISFGVSLVVRALMPRDHIGLESPE